MYVGCIPSKLPYTAFNMWLDTAEIYLFNITMVYIINIAVLAIMLFVRNKAKHVWVFLILKHKTVCCVFYIHSRTEKVSGKDLPLISS